MRIQVVAMMAPIWTAVKAYAPLARATYDRSGPTYIADLLVNRELAHSEDFANAYNHIAQQE